jgi:hypothetical protein
MISSKDQLRQHIIQLLKKRGELQKLSAGLEKDDARFSSHSENEWRHYSLHGEAHFRDINPDATGS